MAKIPGETRQAQIVRAFQATLVSFGYATLTGEITEAAIRKALKGKDEVQGDIIAMFIHGWLNDDFADLKPECEELWGTTKKEG